MTVWTSTEGEYFRKKSMRMRLKLRDQQDDYNMVLGQLEDVDHAQKMLNNREKSRF